MRGREGGRAGGREIVLWFLRVESEGVGSGHQVRCPLTAHLGTRSPTARRQGGCPSLWAVSGPEPPAPAGCSGAPPFSKFSAPCPTPGLEPSFAFDRLSPQEGVMMGVASAFSGSLLFYLLRSSALKPTSPLRGGPGGAGWHTSYLNQCFRCSCGLVF